jgi:predicted O-methyltransferase YrrM
VELARCAYSLEGDPVIVEIGSFLGCSTVLLAGARKLRGTGTVHAVDPFNGGGDEFSIPVYQAIYDGLADGPREAFEANILRAELGGYVSVHQQTGVDAASGWTTPIHMLFLDGDHSYQVVRPTYQSWIPFLQPGGIIAVHNSSPRSYHKDHDGSMRLVREVIQPSAFSEIRCIGTTTFARRNG